MDSKNIAIFIDSLGGGGAERIMLDLAEQMVGLTHNVHFFILETVLDYTIPAGVVVHHFDTKQKRAKLTNAFNIGKSAKQLARQVAMVESEIGLFDLHLVNLDSSNLLLSRCNFKNTYHVVHNSLHQEILRAGRINPIRYWRTLREKRALDNKHLICVSEGVANEIRHSKWISPKSIQTIYNPCDIEKIKTLSQESNVEIPNEPYLLHIGRVVKQKRHDILFQALKDIPDIKLVVLCKNTKKVMKLANKMGVADRVIAPSFQKNPYNWMKNAKLMLFSSEFEGLGMVLIESLICGTPVVSTDCDFGPREILTGPLDKNLAEVNNPSDLATKARQALSQDYELNNLEIINKVGINKITQQYLKLIE